MLVLKPEPNPNKRRAVMDAKVTVFEKSCDEIREEIKRVVNSLNEISPKQKKRDLGFGFSTRKCRSGQRHMGSFEPRELIK